MESTKVAIYNEEGNAARGIVTHDAVNHSQSDTGAIVGVQCVPRTPCVSVRRTTICRRVQSTRANISPSERYNRHQSASKLH
ncbi:hypothetical protein SAMN05444172_0799 [Burkholderia sp. GAS332]|nr:hypothetical protein SAMN05444172_0799 [Burkholderia sp. GAS332]